MHIGSIHSTIPAECEIDVKKQKRDSRLRSIKEVVLDVVLGFLIYLPVNIFVLPYFTNGIEEYSIATALSISAIYTSIAIARKYVIRRWFVNMKNKRKKKVKPKDPSTITVKQTDLQRSLLKAWDRYARTKRLNTTKVKKQP